MIASFFIGLLRAAGMLLLFFGGAAAVQYAIGYLSHHTP
jgi:hypothetical protein